MELMQYTVVLEPDPTGGFVALVPVLPGCVSQGETRQEALMNIREAAELYVEHCIAAGDPVPAEPANFAMPPAHQVTNRST